MTYSIVARDPATGELGAAVQTRWFAVGSGILRAEAGVGVVATQSFAELPHGPNGLALLRAGRSPAEALAELLASDPGEAVRQVGQAVFDLFPILKSHDCGSAFSHRGGDTVVSRSGLQWGRGF